MRLVVQRVANSSVKTEKGVAGAIHKGALVLAGIKKNDSEESVQGLARKLAKLRIMQDEKGKMNCSLVDAGVQVLVVSQFTLHANTRDGNRPSFVESEEPERARVLYDLFVNTLREQGLAVETGSFGEYMKINAELDGPVTIILES